MKMGDCHLSYVPTYTYWCPTCDLSGPRRRSRSESSRQRRSKEKPSPRKYLCSQDGENMDMEYEPHICSNNYEPNYRQQRSNQLCELPTSYITNNCQQQRLLPTVECVEKNARMKPEATKPPKSPMNLFDHTLSFDTGTYFDKIRDASNLHDRYAKEIESVRERIATWKSNGRKVAIEPMKFAPDHFPADKCSLQEVELVREQLANRSHNRPATKELVKATPLELKPKRVAVKTRTKINAIKLKKSKSNTKIVSSVAAPAEFTESDYSGSDETDQEEQLNGDDESESINEIHETISSESQVTATPPGAGDGSVGWPVRPSLFPHVPPYIRFSAHDAEMVVKLPGGRRHFKWKLSTITPVVVRKTLMNTGFAMVRKSNQWLGTWGKHMKSPMFKTLKDTQKLNHFPGTFQLGRKDRLWRNFQRHINKYGYKEFGFIPQTFVLPQELKILKQNWEYKNGGGGETWIIKPPASARGLGIKVINKWSQLPKKQSLVVQKYISNPYLINGSKFDLRLYVLVTSFNPLRIYLYPDGLARFASAKYSDDSKDLKDRYMHLTNYSINKLSSHYTANEDANACQGHKWTITKLLEYLGKQGVDTKSLWRNLQQLVIKTIITGEAPITQLCEENMLSRYNCYELFGVDVLLDENLKPWLLEVNISPSLHSASPLDAHVKGPLVQMLFDLAQFHFPPRLSQTVRQSPQCYDAKMYTVNLTKKEREKHISFEQYEDRNDYLDDILMDLTGDDVRRLLQAEDEFTVKGTFERIFPNGQTYKYLDFMEVRYYNRLFDAWETKYEKNRQGGINRLRALCADKVHLKVAPQSCLNKSSQNMSLGDSNLQPSRDGQSRPLTEVMQEVSIGNNPSCN